MSTYPIEFSQIEKENKRLRAENERLRGALETAKKRFTNPIFGCVWKDAANEIEQSLKEKTDESSRPSKTE